MPGGGRGTRARAWVLPASLLAYAIPAAPAWAWGASGHHWLSQVAAEALPEELPAFLRTAEVPQTVGELGREPDRSKDSGAVHDKERDPGHYVDLDDDGKVAGVLPLEPLPATREAFDTALRQGGTTQYAAGYL